MMARSVFVVSAMVWLAGCGTSGCEEEAYSCDGTVLYQCVDGVEVEQEDCADVGMECHAEMGHCMASDDSGMTMDSGM